jgi:prepilin-type N-terminal cleavage/methylation domain
MYRRTAFTLIELLVVISIIGLLSTIAVVSLSASRAKGRDAKRIADLRQVQQATMMYYYDNDFYPQCGSSDACASTPSYGVPFSTLNIKSGYMPNLPKDPTNTNGQYGYYYARTYKQTGACTYVSTGLATDYILATRLENPTGVSGGCPGGFSGWDNSSLNFLLGN